VQQRWSTLPNGELLRAAEAAGFDVLLTSLNLGLDKLSFTGYSCSVCLRSGYSREPQPILHPSLS